MRFPTRSLALLIIFAAARPYAAQSSAPLQKLPDQNIVMVIDNSSSMETTANPSDPLRLRGVAASLILDAVELTSNVQAGLVVFSDAVNTDSQLHPPDLIRQRVQASRLPPAGGGTNMLEALSRAIAMLSGSKADLRRIVIITDGMPNPGQPAAIISDLVPHAQREGIQIFALSLSKEVDTNFLKAMTEPTGGKMLISDKPGMLLDSAKQLVGDLDNVFLIAHESLKSEQNEYSFEIPAGVDRARLTAILDEPNVFADDQIDFTLTGPTSSDDRPYLIRASGGNRVAAWTTFFSAPGRYTLHVKTSGGHRGLKVYIEALSDLHVELTTTPASRSFVFGSDVRVDAVVTSARGTLQPGELHLTGSVRTSQGGTNVITFSDTHGTFKVPDVAGRHTIIVRAETKLARAEARLEYDAMALAPAKLVSLPAALTFPSMPLSAAQPEIAQPFKVFAEFEQGTPRRKVRMSYTLNSTVGIAEIVTADDTVLRPAPVDYDIPATGLELKLRVRIDSARPFPPSNGKYSGSIIVASNDASPVTIPFTIQVTTPAFELKKKLQQFSLWWDPLRPRTVRIGTLHTDLAKDSTFTVTMPEAIYSEKGTRIADLALQAGDKTPAPESAEAGTLRYNAIPFAAGKDISITMLVTPLRTTGWQESTTRREVEITFLSDLGMKEQAKPAFIHRGSITLPLAGAIRTDGRTIATGLVTILIALILLLRTWSGALVVKRFWHFRPRSILPLRNGPILIGDGDAATAALLLPNSGSELDDQKLGTVSVNGRRQQIENTSGQLALMRSTLSPGDTIGVLDGTGDTRLWELEYMDFSPTAGGEVEVTKSAAPWTVGRIVRGIVAGLVVLLVLRWLLSTGLAATLAYALH